MHAYSYEIRLVVFVFIVGKYLYRITVYDLCKLNNSMSEYGRLMANGDER